jgi:hypothetical protein
MAAYDWQWVTTGRSSFRSATLPFHAKEESRRYRRCGDCSHRLRDAEPDNFTFRSWKRLRSLDTNDIIDINNSAGPQVVEIMPSDAAFCTQSCQPWQQAD